MYKYFFRRNEDFKFNASSNAKNEEIFDYQYQKYVIDKEYNFILITSNIAAETLDFSNSFVLKSKYIVVGQKLKELLEQNGLKVIFCGKNVAECIEFIKTNNFFSNFFSILYLRGNYISTDLKVIFPFIEEIIVYQIIYKNYLSDEFLEDFKNEKIKKLVFLSKKSAEAFLSIIKNLELLEQLQEIEIECVSARIKEAFSGLN